MKRIAIALMIVAAAQATAAEDKSKATPQAKWEAECGSCHIAYPPRFLNAETWQKLMASLNRHFGDNASVDPSTSQEILEYLKRNASYAANRSSKTLRITDTAWFAREHHELSPRAWTDPAVKSAANCTACHINATRGDWSEHGVRLPPGLGGDGEEGEEDDDD